MSKEKFELRNHVSILRGLTHPIKVHPYVPQRRQLPSRSVDVFSSWAGIDTILADIIERFQIKTKCALEFGVERGFSTVALSSYFNQVIGVDTFQGDEHTKFRKDIYAETSQRLAPFENIQLIQSDYKDFCRDHQDSFFDLVHVDIIHTFVDTYNCGLWSAQRSQCTIFHDTESFRHVKQAVRQIARVTGKKFYNFDENYGLGIIV